MIRRVIATTIFAALAILVGAAPAFSQAAFAKAGSFDSPTVIGNQSVTALGFTPKVVIFSVANHGNTDTVQDDHHKGIGVAISPTVRQAGSVEAVHGLVTSDVVLAMTDLKAIHVAAVGGGSNPILSADFVSMDADGFTLNWTEVWTSAIKISYLALGGESLQVAAGKGVARTDTIGTADYTGVGFQPEAIITWATVSFDAASLPFTGSVNSSGFIGWATSTAQAVHGFNTNNGQNPAISSTRQLTSHVVTYPTASSAIREASFDSFLPDGFRLNWTTVNTFASEFHWIAFRGIPMHVGTFNVSAGVQSVTGVGFEPIALLALSANKAPNTGTTDHFRATWAATDGTNSWNIWGGDTDGVSPTVAVTQQDHVNAFRIGVEGAGPPVAVTTQALATHQSFDLDGFTWNWTTADVTGQQVLFMAFGDPANANTQRLLLLGVGEP